MCPFLLPADWYSQLPELHAGCCFAHTAQAVRRWIFIVEARIQYRDCLSEVSGGRSGTGTDFSLNIFGFTPLIIPPLLSTHLSPLIRATELARKHSVASSVFKLGASFPSRLLTGYRVRESGQNTERVRVRNELTRDVRKLQNEER
jgi:hypothetical protein